MFSWLTVLLGRIAGGEPLEPARHGDYRMWFSSFFLLPVLTFIFAKVGALSSITTSAFRIWFTFFVLAVIGLVVWAISSRFVPALVSLILAIIVWSVGVWMAWHGKLGF